MRLIESYRCFLASMVTIIAILANGAFAVDKFDVGVQQALSTEFTGDYPELTKRRLIRALVPYSKTFYFLDGAQEKGATYELLKEFENFINTELGTKHLKVHVVVIPTSRERLIPAILEGKGDIAAGNLTITEDRLAHAAFSDPFGSNVKEVIVTTKGKNQLKSINDIGGKTVHVRKSSSYYEHLLLLNEKFVKTNTPPVELESVSDYLEDEDLLEMVNAGLIQMIAMDNFKAKLWLQVFTNITVNDNIAINSGGKIAWAMRKNNPELKEVIDRFVKKNKKGTLFGNIIFKRYLVNTSFIKNNIADQERQTFSDTVELFKKYGKQYSLDYLLLMALAYQESGIDQSKKSPAGAIGVMQVLPSTAKDKNVGIPDITTIEPNIHAGTKYIRFMVDQYFDEPELTKLNRALFAFASYNAGPNKVARLREEASKSGLDPNIWFRNVEAIAAKRIGRETVKYVSNIFKYYTAYKMFEKQMDLKQRAYDPDNSQ